MPRPGSYDFVVRRGDTERLAVILKGQDVFTREMAPIDMTGTVARWRVDLPDGPQEVTSAPGGGLAYDAATGELSWPMAPAFTLAFPGKTPVGHALRLVSAEATTTWLVGTITAEG